VLSLRPGSRITCPCTCPHLSVQTETAVGADVCPSTVVRVVIDYESGVPYYRQVAVDLRRRIEDGRLRPRRALSSEGRLQSEYGVARDTIRRAIAYLAELGLVYTVRRAGDLHPRWTHRDRA
jgi:GntR family transcriptional regulator